MNYKMCIHIKNLKSEIVSIPRSVNMCRTLDAKRHITSTQSRYLCWSWSTISPDSIDDLPKTGGISCRAPQASDIELLIRRAIRAHRLRRYFFFLLLAGSGLSPWLSQAGLSVGYISNKLTICYN
ncbi:uncharacterized protein BDW43DRAFT_268801 [Aspergillus alliaceus]|uniref:uncharacterized protein n=1 Tax=Petromyces alliaceus TaxID=209559 RepID=UPI0012A4FEB9|nr:uncharacterized protein BDW43DRAFT_268801 [Aspergillus alliaceus]KAB8235999.1 hypothetical protein BDW43DRAFT_268801 [Aspergillus alliaceus]